MDYETLKWLHILSSTLLFGTGLGSAYYKWFADRSGNLPVMAHTNRMVVIADWVFTTPTVFFQPISGLLLMQAMGYSMTEPWLLSSYALYVIAGACWLPVVWLQIRMRDLSLHALDSHESLSVTYWRYTKIWFWLGVPAFGAIVIVYLLMVLKPA